MDDKSNIRPLFLTRGASFDDSMPGPRQFRNFIDAVSHNGIIPTILTVKGPVSNKLNQAYSVNEIPFRYIDAIMRRIFPDMISLPDSRRFSTNPLLIRKAIQIIKENKYDYILTNSFPSSTHLVGLKLKKKVKLPWIAQFYDPWVGNPYRVFKTQYFQKLDAKIEKSVAENADIILHSNETIKEDWINRYGDIVANKIFVLPFLYDYMSYNAAINRSTNAIPKDRIIISYIGNLVNKRNMDDLIPAIMLFIKEYPILRDRIFFRFIGDVTPHDLKKIADYQLNDLFDIVGKLPFSQLQSYYENTNILLVIDHAMGKNIFFPSKLIDYFLYKKPILGITPLIGPTSTYLKEAGHYSYANNDINGIANYFKIAITDYQSLLNFDNNYFENFSPDLIAKQYIDIVKNIFCRKISN